MQVLVLREVVSAEDMAAMREAHGSFIKLAVDVERGVVAGGGDYHADCEEALLRDGSEQQDVWGADWHPDDQTVTFEALINIRPRDDNPSLVVRSRALRRRIEEIVRAVFVAGSA